VIDYKVYYSQGGKYTLRAFVTKPGYANTGLTPNSE